MKQQLKSTLALSAGVLAVVGIVLAPTAGAANTTAVTANVSKTAAISTTSGTVALNINPTSSGSFSSASDTVTAGTNSTAGYNLQVSAATTTLTKGADTIAASAGTPASPVTLLKNTWGYRVDNGAGTFGAGPTSAQTDQASLALTWAGVTSTPTTIKSTAVANNADVTTVWYGAGVDFTKPNGAYTTTVTYTAVAL
jgi:hypothetical protein